MSNRYTPDHKTAAMVLLERNRGNIQMTAQQAGVPERTLQAWQGEIRPYLQQFFPANVSPAGDTPAFANDLEALAFIRQNMIGELSRLSASLQHDAGFTTPYQRALVMSQLMDKLLKLDLHLRPYMDDDEEMELSDDVEETDDEEDA
jgi:hypothetical protein